MSYKEYILMKKKYMHEDQKNNANETFDNASKEKEQEIKKEEKMKIRSKSRGEKIRNFNFKDDLGNIDKEIKKNKNLNENGIEVLNENLFKNRKEFKPLRKTFTGRFFKTKDKFNNNNKGYKTNYGNFFKK